MAESIFPSSQEWGLPGTLGMIGWGTHRLQKQQLALMFQKNLVLHWNQFVLLSLKLGACSGVCSWEMCVKCGGAAGYRPTLTTPMGIGNRHSKTWQRPDQGTDDSPPALP